MTPKQKAIKLLSQMPEPFRAWALENLEICPVKNEYEVEDIVDAINLFWWHRTKQGGDFWEAVIYHYEFDSPLPELSIEYRYEQLVKENEELKKKVAELESKLNTQTK